jgi:hypothetical protein
MVQCTLPKRIFYVVDRAAVVTEEYMYHCYMLQGATPLHASAFRA